MEGVTVYDGAEECHLTSERGELKIVKDHHIIHTAFYFTIFILILVNCV